MLASQATTKLELRYLFLQEVRLENGGKGSHGCMFKPEWALRQVEFICL